MFWKMTKHGEMIPRGYRVVYYDVMRQVAWCYPIGLHYVAILIRRVWIWTYVWPNQDWLEKHDLEIERVVTERIHPLYRPDRHVPDTFDQFHAELKRRGVTQEQLDAIYAAFAKSSDRLVESLKKTLAGME